MLPTLNSKLTIRVVEPKDIFSIANYWLTSEASYLESMGVDLGKLPTRKVLENMLQTQINSPVKEKKSYALIGELSGTSIGHCNVNDVCFGKQAFMHLHLWKPEYRRKGLGTAMVKSSLPYFFKNLKLKQLICEPYALNPAPNKTMEKIGFKLVKKYKTIPGSLSFEQEVYRWILTKEMFEDLQGKNI